MEKEACGREWEVCVEEWRTLARQIKEGRYEMPIACLVFNGKSRSLVVHDVLVHEERSPCETTVELMTEGDRSLILTSTQTTCFKAGKDKNGMGKTVFLTDLNR